MDIDLLKEGMLDHSRRDSGNWLCELQVDRRLIYVEHRHDERPRTRLAIVQQVIQAVWDDIPQALKFAEQCCRAEMPELMRLYETHMPSESPFDVYSIHFDLNNPHPSYTISKSHDFDWDRIVIDEDGAGNCRSVRMVQLMPGDDFWVDVSRLGFRQFEFEG